METKILNSKVSFGTLSYQDKVQPFQSLAGVIDFMESVVKEGDDFIITIDHNSINENSPEMTVISDIALGNGFKCVGKQIKDNQVSYKYEKKKSI